ncbi:putative histidine kinase sensor of two-component system [Actinomadura sp. NBRC 104425]|uniref:sensor histidine kinase n=1 Tax=Actinomadura sp. NBRC 104425 TaxID=3032204 RepID=UPI0024A50AE3|nr:HAMP domain-containing sensor histidine kinase [Actinomadura sp. NBRC 104425]GLZ13685.1 putative histidine kinase sensor of two-component system [Actinomadura sp. NBRC 104425]
MSALDGLRARLPRPLDPLRSIKIKFGVVAVVTACTAILIVVWGYALGFRTRHTLPVGMLISLGVTQLIAHGMTSPLREMTAAARAMARGDYSRRVRATSRDEVGELATAFNTMAADLAEADRQRREFVANVSHELRTPISALHAVLENVADGVTPATPEVLESALEQTERLGRLVTQLLDLSRVDAGAAALDLAEFDVAAFVADVAAEAEAGHPGVQVDTDVPAGLRALADRDRLHQVLANLLDNAARHGPPGRPVTVTARPGGDGGLVLEVADEGPGIPPSERARVFERFSRGTGSYGRQVGARDGGTGLGLAIARWAVELHGGDIHVVDTARGCRIRVTIPADPAAAAEAGRGCG